MFSIQVSTNALSNSSMSLYADDLLLYRTIQSPSDYQTLQAEINALSDWISAHKLQLNCDKCKCMLVTRKRDSTMPTVLLISGQPLERVYSYKYLGILLTSDLSWSAHISTICSKARQQIGMLYHKFYRYSDVDTLKQLCVAFIRPHLEYATAVWDLSKDKQELESVQRFACRVCTKSWDDAYCDMLHTLNIPLLSERRKLLKMCHLYKIIHGLLTFLMHHYCISLHKIRTSSHTPSTSDSHKLLLLFLFFTCCT